MPNSSTASRSEPSACPNCLRRGQLLAALAPYLERAAADGDVSNDLGLSGERLAAIAAPGPAERLLSENAELGERDLRSSLAASDCWATCPHDDLFPAALLDDACHPWAIYGRGDPRQLARRRSELVAIVGARRATSYGREVARELGRELSEAGLTVISGMAFGIDACAHRGALDSGDTIAVLGCGPNVAYPATHRSLWRRIQESGAVISELPPGTGAWRWAFPARNRIIAAMAEATIVVEAAARSGSLSTADSALRVGRIVGAVPGPINSPTSVGTNALIAKGALVVRGAVDVVERLRDDSWAEPPSPKGAGG